MTFKVKDGLKVADKVAINSDGTSSFAGTVTAPTFSGNLSGNVTGNVTGAVTGNASSASKVNSTLTRGTYLTGSNFDGSAATTWAVDATSANTASKVVARDASGNFSAGTITATFSGNLTGNVTGTVSGNAGTVTNGVYTTDNVVTARATAIDSTTADFNTFTTAGTYQVTSSGTAQAGPNAPAGAYGWGQLIVAVNGNLVTQMYVTHGTVAEIFVRFKYNASDWNAWQRVVNTTNISSFAPSLTGTGASGTWAVSVTGNAATVTNGVYTTGNQTIGGTKNFSGNVGIGEDTPLVKLHVQRTGPDFNVTLGSATTAAFVSGGVTGSGSEVAIVSGDSGAAILSLGGQTTYNLAGMQYDNSTNTLTIKSNGSNRVSIDSAGAVSFTGLLTGSTGAQFPSLTLYDATDNTKKANFVMSSISTGTTRSFTFPNISGTLAVTANISQTFSGTTTFSGATLTFGSSTVTSTTGLAAGATASGSTKTVNIGTGGVAGSTTNINFGPTAGAATYTFSGTSALNLPAGTTAQRPTGTAGDIRYNSSISEVESFDGTAWDTLPRQTDVVSTPSGVSVDISSTDLDSLGVTGFYKGQTLTNAPDTGYWFVTCEVHSSGHAKQMVTAYGVDGASRPLYPRGTTFVRVKNTTWGTWQSVGGGAKGGGSDQIFYENDQTVTANYSITAGKNASTVGPLSINSGVTVTVPSGSRLVIL